jgi:hypothetical protein
VAAVVLEVLEVMEELLGQEALLLAIIVLLPLMLQLILVQVLVVQTQHLPQEDMVVLV